MCLNLTTVATDLILVMKNDLVHSACESVKNGHAPVIALGFEEMEVAVS